jgi:hypothetical protein
MKIFYYTRLDRIKGRSQTGPWPHRNKLLFIPIVKFALQQFCILDEPLDEFGSDLASWIESQVMKSLIKWKP